MLNGHVYLLSTASDRGVATPVKWAEVSITGSGDTTVVAAVTGKKLRILSMWFRTGPLGTALAFKSGSNILVDALALVASTEFNVSCLPQGYLFETAAGQAFVINSSVAIGIHGALNYVEV